MKKLAILGLFLLFGFSLAGCSSKETLYVLNWGEYMDMGLVRAFEKKYDVRVEYVTVGSNEAMENQLKLRQTNYDIMIPSEYMIDKLQQEGWLREIDRSKLTNYSSDMFFQDARDLYENESFGPYMIPYFFGTVGIIYNTTNPAVEAALQADGICALFDENTPFNIGMYNSARDAVGAALICLGYSVNTTNSAELLAAEALLSNANFARFGEDTLKSDVGLGILDMALVYSGDYFDLLYVYEEDDIEVSFDFYTPQVTNLWIDGFVIPTSSKNVDLAHKFIDFFLEFDNAVENADYVGYTPVIEAVFNYLVDEYGYDNVHYYPVPDGHTREVYRFISEAHSNQLFDILTRVR